MPETTIKNNVAGDPTTTGATSRYCGLDALRAWAMSMGLVLHASWIMIPGEAGAPMTDASASEWMNYVCLTIHTFRMQLFFVLAGFFACLLLRKRGLASFIGNRTLHIAIPLVLAWIVLCPIMVYQYNAAGIQSGAIVGNVDAATMTWEYFQNLSSDSVMLMHLWFLYYLCWTYVLVLLVRVLLQIVDRDSKLCNRLSALAGRVLTRPWAVFILAGFLAPWLLPMKTTWGIDVGLISLTPKWPGLLSYVGYFGVGWLIYRNRDKLPQIVAGWRWQLAAGLLLTIPYYFYSNHAARNGYVTWDYPQINIEDLRHENALPVWGELRSAIMNADEGSIAGALWKLLPEENREFVSAHPEATPNQIFGVLNTINSKVLVDHALTDQTDPTNIPFSKAAMACLSLTPDQRTSQQNTLINREILEAGLPGILYTEDVHRPYYWAIRTCYCYVYTLMTWLLIFGCLGFSQHFFAGESRFWRYFSDASYWFYLAHLPVQFQLLLWFGGEPWHWTVKFSLYVLGTLAVLWPSYHLLVRPTWIGWVLNGRRYRLKATRSAAAVPAVATVGATGA